MSRALTLGRARDAGGQDRLFAHPLEIVILALAVGVAGVLLTGAAVRWNLLDVDAYWDAALRLRNGEPLYPAYRNVDAFDVYRYAPWFAYLWVPLTYLPRAFVDAAWSLLLVGASVMAVWHLLASRRAPTIALGAVVLSLLVLAASWGNVQPILIAGLVHTVDRRTGPAWIGVAASLKFAPILYVLVYIGRREWGRAAAAIGITAVLLGPMLLFDLSGYTTDPGEPLISLYNISPALWAAAAAAGVVAASVASFRRSRLAWLVVNAAILLALPRTHLNYFSYAAVGTRRKDSAAGEDASAG